MEDSLHQPRANTEPEDNHPRKRQRFNDTSDSQRKDLVLEQHESNRNAEKQRNKSYRSQHDTKSSRNQSYKRSIRAVGSTRLAARKHSSRPPQEQDRGDMESNNKDDEVTSNRRSKRVRKENPSTRIRSIRNQLARGTLPPPIVAEKERELASLLFDQSKAKTRSEGRKNLERYHFIRFIERQKAQRNLKKLERLQAAGATISNTGSDIREQIENTKVDINYTIYAPLGEKYTGIFSDDTHGPKSRPKANESAEESVDDERDKTNGGNEVHRSSSKPPMWYEIKNAMALDGEEAQRATLEKLRDRVVEPPAGSARADARTDNTMINLNATRKKASKSKHEVKPDVVDIKDKNNNKIKTRDFQPPKKTMSQKRNTEDTLHAKNEDPGSDSDSDSDTSDGDGGFFER